MPFMGRDSYPLQFHALNHAAPLASTTYYIGGALNAPGTVAAIRPILVPLPGTVQLVSIWIVCATPGTTETGTISLRLNDTTDYAIRSDVQWNLGKALYTNQSIPLIADEVTYTDFFEIKIATPAWVTPPLNVFYWGHVTLADDI